MRTVGEILKKSRLEKKLTLKEIEEQTKIRKEYLIALEENHYQDLPSAAYIQGFIKNYSQVLGLKPEPLLAIFRRDYEEKERSVLNFTQSQSFRWTPKLTLISLFILALLLFVGYLFWQYHLLQKSPYRSFEGVDKKSEMLDTRFNYD